jgi:hypothetical protein
MDRRLLQPLDYVVVIIAVIVVGSSYLIWRQALPAQRVRIDQAGKLYQEVDLSVKKIINVQGPLGPTQVQIDAGRARILSDPSPRQYCVHSGWLDKTGQIAICLPNRTSITIVQQTQATPYDSLHY